MELFCLINLIINAIVFMCLPFSLCNHFYNKIEDINAFDKILKENYYREILI